jgi:hypothetical protein
MNAMLEIRIHEEGSHPVENWQANWREHFHPVKVGQSLNHSSIMGKPE